MLVTRQHESGILLTEQVEGDAALRRALKRVDDQLLLWPPDAMSPYWRVLRRVSDDQPAQPVLTWMDERTGEPLPLTSGIVDAVQRLRRDGRYRPQTTDERNAELSAAVDKRIANEREALHDDFAAYLERGRVSVGMGDRSTRKPYWLRRGRGGDLPS